MNKDLDERLVPNSEYRDALNLEIASSENSQVGSFQNIKGNTELFYESSNLKTGSTAFFNVMCVGLLNFMGQDMHRPRSVRYAA